MEYRVIEKNSSFVYKIITSHKTENYPAAPKRENGCFLSSLKTQNRTGRCRAISPSSGNRITHRVMALGRRETARTACRSQKVRRKTPGRARRMKNSQGKSVRHRAGRIFPQPKRRGARAGQFVVRKSRMARVPDTFFSGKFAPAWCRTVFRSRKTTGHARPAVFSEEKSSRHGAGGNFREIFFVRHGAGTFSAEGKFVGHACRTFAGG